jgi:outer membrane protein OmpA-like peptidoglycan-associated protein
MNRLILSLIVLLSSMLASAQIERADSIMAAEYSIKSIDANSKYSDFGSTFMGEKIVFSSTRRKPGINNKVWRGNKQPFLDLYIGDLSSSGEVENVRSFSEKVNTKYHDAFVSFSSDLKEVYFTSNDKVNKRIKSKSVKIFKASVAENGEWTKFENLPFNSDGHDAGHPYISRDGERIYFVSDMPGTLGDKDVFYVEVRNGYYGKPINLGPTVNSPYKEYTPYIDGDLIYFSSNRKGGEGGLDIYVTKLDGSLAEPINLGKTINSKGDDFSFIINSEKLQGYFSSNREGGEGDDDIYTFVQKTTIVLCDQSVAGVVKDKLTGAALKNALVTLIDSEGVKVRTVSTLADGTFYFGLDCAVDYSIEVTKNGFFAENTAIRTSNANGFENELEVFLDEKEFVTRNGVELLNVETIVFELNKAEIKKESEKSLGKVIRLMNKYPTMVIDFGAHTDARGPDALNLLLSIRRAQATVDYLITQGIEATRITGQGFGEKKLLNECSNSVKCTELQHKENKRTEFTVVKKE